MPTVPLLLLLAGAAPPDDVETALQTWANQRVPDIVQRCSAGMLLHGAPQGFTVELRLASGQVTRASTTPVIPSLSPCIQSAFRGTTDAPVLDEELQVEVPVELVVTLPLPVSGPGDARAELRTFTVSRGTRSHALKAAIAARINRCALKADRMEPLQKGRFQLAFSAAPGAGFNEPKVLRGTLGAGFRNCLRTTVSDLTNPGPQNFRAVGTFTLHPASQEHR